MANFIYLFALSWQDYSIECFQGEHAFAVIMALVCLGLYVVGIPLYFLLYLRKNRKKLNDPGFVAKFGGVYLAYKTKNYWFESFEMVKKIILVGGIVLINPGSMSQVLLGFLIAFTFYTVVVGYAPYEEGVNTKLQILTTGQLLLALVLGLVLSANTSTDNVEDYENTIIDVLLVGSGVIVFVVSIYMMLTGAKEKMETAQKLGKHKMSKRTKTMMHYLTCACCCVICGRKKKKETNINTTKIVPISEESQRLMKVKQLQQMQQLRSIRVKYGADSEEYKNAIDLNTEKGNFNNKINPQQDV